jgi:uncharacterized membrane protein YfcA
MGVLGMMLVQQLPPDALRAAIGCFVLLATWAPHALLLGRHPERIERGPRFLLLGAVAGVMNVTLGAVGPLIAPFFLGLGLSRFELVGTKAGCQTLGHLVKIGLYGAAGFAFLAFAPLLALLVPLAFAGTWLGSRLLDRVDERTFGWLYRGVLTLVALRLVASALES